jgi:hypothetical protein
MNWLDEARLDSVDLPDVEFVVEPVAQVVESGRADLASVVSL